MLQAHEYFGTEHFSDGDGDGYVFEGSALGANVIRKQLTKADVQTPACINLITSTAESRWKLYIRKLDTYRDVDTILVGTVSTFEYITYQTELNQ